MTIYQNQSIWLPTVCAVCPSQDTTGDGTTTLTDFANVSNGTLTNMDAATDWVTSDSKRALDFDGTNDHVINAYCPIAGATKLSLSCWLKKASSSYGPHISVSSSLTELTSRITLQPWNDGQVYFTMSAAFGYFALNDTNWHHVLVVYDGSGAANADRLKMWCDGTAKTLAFSGTIPTVIPTALYRLILGETSAAGALYGAGLLDDVRVTLHIPTSDERTMLSSGRGAAYAAAASGSVRLVNIRGGADQ